MRGATPKVIFTAVCCIVCTALHAGNDLFLRSLNGYTGYTWHTGRQDSIVWGAGLSAVVSSGRYAPFWFSANRDGMISVAPFSGNMSLYLGKRRTQYRRWMDYDFGVEIQGQVSTSKPEILVRQLYASARLLVFDITVGIKPAMFGYYDPNRSLSSGGMLFSRNSRPIPHVFVGMEDYVPFPFLFGYVEVKGGITHGWFVDDVYVRNAYLHHKFAGVRLGGSLPVNVGYEFHHAAQWGGWSPVYGALGSSFDSFKNIFLAGSGGGMANDQLNAEGNHIGSQALFVEAKWQDWKLKAYWEMIFEDGPIYFMWDALNSHDGVWGITLSQNRFPFIKSFLYEFVNTTHQSGAFHDCDGIVYGGGDNYFNNSIYRNGWNFMYMTIGTPFITSPVYNGDMTVDCSTLNNRVRLHHFGVEGDIYGYEYRVLASFVRNFGTYGTPRYSDNTALLFEVKKHFRRAWGLDFGLSLGMDFGSQFGNSVGAMFTVSKRGLIWRY